MRADAAAGAVPSAGLSARIGPRMTTREHGTLDAEKTRAVELLRRAHRFLLCGHMRPDGDCIGAQAALSRVLESMGKDVWVVNPDPPEGRFDYLARDVRYRTFAGGIVALHTGVKE